MIDLQLDNILAMGDETTIHDSVVDLYLLEHEGNEHMATCESLIGAIDQLLGIQEVLIEDGYSPALESLVGDSLYAVGVVLQDDTCSSIESIGEKIEKGILWLWQKIKDFFAWIKSWFVKSEALANKVNYDIEAMIEEIKRTGGELTKPLVFPAPVIEKIDEPVVSTPTEPEPALKVLAKIVEARKVNTEKEKLKKEHRARAKAIRRANKNHRPVNEQTASKTPSAIKAHVDHNSPIPGNDTSVKLANKIMFRYKEGYKSLKSLAEATAYRKGIHAEITYAKAQLQGFETVMQELKARIDDEGLNQLNIRTIKKHNKEEAARMTAALREINAELKDADESLKYYHTERKAMLSGLLSLKKQLLLIKSGKGNDIAKTDADVKHKKMYNTPTNQEKAAMKN